MESKWTTSVSDSDGIIWTPTTTVTVLNPADASVLCPNCGRRPASENWVGEGGMLDYVHGFYQRWCKLCCLKAQLEYARKQVERIPDLEKQLAEEEAK